MTFWEWLRGLTARPQAAVVPAPPLPPAPARGPAQAARTGPPIPVMAFGDDQMPWLTEGALKRIFPAADAAGWIKPLRDAMAAYGITTRARAKHFLAQVGHESQGMTVMEESLYYSTPGRLQAVFGRARFPTVESEAPFRRNPRALAGKVYDDRADLGNNRPGDGWLFRGKGLIQTTGRYNHQVLAEALGMGSAEAVTDFLMTKQGAAISAAFFFQSTGLNAVADRGGAEMVEAVTRRVNPALVGLADRKAYYGKADSALGEGLA